jgi:restriction system protein
VEPSGEILTADELPPVSLRIGDLESANSPVMGVDSDQSLAAAITLMLANDYSQLAIRDSAGAVRAVSWESIAKASVAYPNVTLAHATVGARIVDHDADLLAQVSEIYKFGYVLVRGPDRVSITGIVTTADLTLQFAAMARPIALIEEVERRLRRRADEVFTLEELRAGANSPNRIKSAADLTLGAYDNRLLVSEESFRRLGWKLDHKLFLSALTSVRRIRNELMHFSTDPLTVEQIQSIEGLVNMLRTVDPRA